MKEIVGLSTTAVIALVIGCSKEEATRAIDARIQDAGTDARSATVEAELGICYGKNTRCNS